MATPLGSFDLKIDFSEGERCLWRKCSMPFSKHAKGNQRQAHNLDGESEQTPTTEA